MYENVDWDFDEKKTQQVISENCSSKIPDDNQISFSRFRNFCPSAFKRKVGKSEHSCE